MSSQPKVAVIGSGSYVFTPGLLHDLLVSHRMEGCELVLVDLNESLAEAMAGVARRMAQDAGIHISVTATTDRVQALSGASFVTSSVAVQLKRRWELDREALHRHGIRETMSECGGIGGLAYTLRSVPLVLSIARDMELLCPDAWLLNMTNPLPRVVTAVAKYSRVRVLGFCNVAHGGIGGYVNIGRLLRRSPQELEVISAGLNHFAWLLSVRDRTTGEDLMPAIAEVIAQGAIDDQPQILAWWRQYGALPLSGASHVGEFLPFDPIFGREWEAHHGDDRERDMRTQALHEIAAGRQSWEALLAHRAWERPGDVIHALTTGAPLRLDMVNMVNRGCIEELPDDAVVEAPAQVADGDVRGIRVGALPESVADICGRVSAVHSLAAEAAVRGDRGLVEEAILCDPAITDKEGGIRAIRELLDVHADVLPQFA